jgi:hypothetical protein
MCPAGSTFCFVVVVVVVVVVGIPDHAISHLVSKTCPAGSLGQQTFRPN